MVSGSYIPSAAPAEESEEEDEAAGDNNDPHRGRAIILVVRAPSCSWRRARTSAPSFFAGAPPPGDRLPRPRQPPSHDHDHTRPIIAVAMGAERPSDAGAATSDHEEDADDDHI